MYIILFFLTAMSLIVFTQSQVIPSSFSLSTAETGSVNGSSATGHCCSITTGDGMTTCTQPTTSVLFDGNIPALTGLDGDMWASQLLILKKGTSVTRINFDFTSTADYSGLGSVQVVFFHCPQWGISAHTRLTSSCDSLVRLCMPIDVSPMMFTTTLELDDPLARWELIAEVTFYGSDSNCPPDAVITPPPPVTPTAPLPVITTTTAPTPSPIAHLPVTITTIITTTTAPTSTPSSPTAHLPVTTITTITAPTSTPTSTPSSPMQGATDMVSSESFDRTTAVPPTIIWRETCPSCSTSTVLVSVVTAIATALLATVIFVLVQVAVCKCRHPNFTPEGAEIGEMDVVYEQVCEGGQKAPSDPTYMEIGTATVGGSTFQLQENEAYICRK